MTPKRVQLRRTKGWRKPEGAIVVARPSKWGNPFPAGGAWMVWTAVALGYNANPAGRRTAAVALHRAWLTGEPPELGPHAASSGGTIEFTNGLRVGVGDHCRTLAAAFSGLCAAPTVPEPPHDFEELRGHDLACWCPEGPCHADLLIELSNR